MIPSILVTACTIWFASTAAPAGRPPQPPDGPPESIEQYARSRPELPREHGAVTLPLTTEEPFAWRGVRDGVACAALPAQADTHASLKVSYTRTRGQPAGCALVFRPGTLAGLASLEFSCRGNRVQRLMVCLKDSTGLVWNMGGFDAAPESARVELPARRIELDRYQNPGKDRSAAFDPSQCNMLTILDINGYMSAGEPVCEWTITDLKANLAAPTPPRPPREDAPAAAPAHAPAPSPADPKPAPAAPAAKPAQQDPSAPGAPGEAEHAFLEALTRHPERRADASTSLVRALAQHPTDPTLNLYLGLCHLWTAAEWTTDDPAVLSHLVLAEHYLQRARELAPDDGRIDSWLSAAAIHRARIEADAQAEERAWRRLAHARELDPCFHGVALGLLRFPEPAGTPAFLEGLEAMRAGLQCASGNPSGENRPTWPHNVEGFLLALCQYEHKAGHPDEATKWMTVLQSRDDYATWPSRTLAERVRDAWENPTPSPDRPAPDPAPAFVLSRQSGIACTVCHLASREQAESQAGAR